MFVYLTQPLVAALVEALILKESYLADTCSSHEHC
jgi:hypothetical protein